MPIHKSYCILSRRKFQYIVHRRGMVIMTMIIIRAYFIRQKCVNGHDEVSAGMNTCAVINSTPTCPTCLQIQVTYQCQ